MVWGASRAHREYIGVLSIIGESSVLAAVGPGSPALDVGLDVEVSERGQSPATGTPRVEGAPINLGIGLVRGILTVRECYKSRMRAKAAAAWI